MSLIINNSRRSIYNQSSSLFSLTKYLSPSAKRAISSSKISIEKTQDLSRFANKPKNEDLQFGKTLSDHMLVIEWDKEHQWNDPKIIPYQDLRISPAATCLNYGMWKIEI